MTDQGDENSELEFVTLADLENREPEAPPLSRVSSAETVGVHIVGESDGESGHEGDEDENEGESEEGEGGGEEDEGYEGGDEEEEGESEQEGEDEDSPAENAESGGLVGGKEKVRAWLERDGS